MLPHLTDMAGLQFVDHVQVRASHWQFNNLDVYTPAKFRCHIVYYLVDVEGYVVICHCIRHYIFSLGTIKCVLSVCHGERNIDVIIFTESSALSTLTQFWGTHLMNYLLADNFCITYPGVGF